MKKQYLFLLLSIPFIMNACSGSKKSTTKTSTFWVSGIKSECTAGAGKMLCLNVYRGDNLDEAEWENFYAPIEGFEFEEGLYQKIEVSEKKLDSSEVPADGSSIQYSLVEVLEKDEDQRVKMNGDWTTARLNGGPIGRKFKAPTASIDLSKQLISGNDGCNNFSGMINNVTVSKIEFGQLAGTQKMCMDMTVADQFNKAMAQVVEYKFTKDQVLLFDENETELVAFIPAPPPTNTELLSQSWTAVEVKGKKLTRMTQSPVVTFDIPNNKVMGNDGCNDFSGTIGEVDDKILDLGELALTQKSCRDMDTATDFNEALAACATYEVTEKTLTMYDPEGNKMATLIPTLK